MSSKLSTPSAIRKGIMIVWNSQSLAFVREKALLAAIHPSMADHFATSTLVIFNATTPVWKAYTTVVRMTSLVPSRVSYMSSEQRDSQQTFVGFSVDNR